MNKKLSTITEGEEKDEEMVQIEENAQNKPGETQTMIGNSEDAENELIPQEALILSAKTQCVQEDDDEQDVAIETLKNIQDIVEYWIEQGQIEGALGTYEENTTCIKDTCDCSKWLSKPKASGTRTINVEIFFTMLTGTPFRNLA